MSQLTKSWGHATPSLLLRTPQASSDTAQTYYWSSIGWGLHWWIRSHQLLFAGSNNHGQWCWLAFTRASSRPHCSAIRRVPSSVANSSKWSSWPAYPIPSFPSLPRWRHPCYVPRFWSCRIKLSSEVLPLLFPILIVASRCRCTLQDALLQLNRA